MTSPPPMLSQCGMGSGNAKQTHMDFLTPSLFVLSAIAPQNGGKNIFTAPTAAREWTVTEMYEELVRQLRILSGTDNISTFDEAADAIEELSKPRWIPVTEQCPEKSGDYLVFDDCRNLYVNEWHCLLKKWQYDDSRITHWMPLPEPPKGET